MCQFMLAPVEAHWQAVKTYPKISSWNSLFKFDYASLFNPDYTSKRVL